MLLLLLLPPPPPPPPPPAAATAAAGDAAGAVCCKGGLCLEASSPAIFDTGITVVSQYFHSKGVTILQRFRL